MIRRWIANCLLLAGVIALGVWAWSIASGRIFQSWQNWVFDREMRGEPATITQYLIAKKDQIAERVLVWWGFPAAPKPSVPPDVVPPVVPPPSVEGNGLVGRLTIPRLHLGGMVREGTGESTLDLALGHIPGTALPGQKGNVGVAGHRDTLFRGLGSIRKNDQILFETLGGTYVYEVESTQIVRPQAVSVLKASEYPELTLVTCYPFNYVGSAPERFIVKARQVSGAAPEQNPSETQQEIAQQANQLSAQRQKTAEDESSQDQPASVDDGLDQTENVPDGGGHKPGVRKVSFRISKTHSRELTPGVRLGITETDARRRRMDGWMWLMPDRRTVWLRDHDVREPIVLYGYEDGKKRELVITNVSDDSVTGYLLAPESGATRPRPRRPSRMARLNSIKP